MRFTSDEAFDASDCGEPIILNQRTCEYICHEHGVTFGEYLAEHPDTRDIDAAQLLRWLGY